MKRFGALLSESSFSPARGDAYHRQHLRLYPEARRQDPAFQRELAEQVVWVERTHEAVHQGLDTYQELLSHVEPKIRMNAAYTLAQFKEDAPATVTLLRALLEREDDQRAKASMMLSLGVLGEPTTENLALLAAILRAEGAEVGNALSQLVAATALTWIARDETPEEAVHVLVDMLTRPKPTSLFDVYVELPWAHGSLAGFAGRTLRWQLSRERLRAALPRLVEALEVVDAYDVGEVIQTLLYVAFGREKLPEPIRVQQLTEEQREVLTIIAQSHAAWHPAPGISASMSTGVIGPTGSVADPDSVVVMNDDLRALRLPEMQKDLQDFLHSGHGETR